jgi:hypothetical protein
MLCSLFGDVILLDQRQLIGRKHENDTQSARTSAFLPCAQTIGFDFWGCQDFLFIDKENPPKFIALPPHLRRQHFLRKIVVQGGDSTLQIQGWWQHGSYHYPASS